MKGYVKSVVPSKSGKAWRVQIGDKYYGANFDSKLDTAVGQSIDFDYDDGKFGLWIKTWGLDHSTTPTPPSQAPVSPPGQASRVSNGDRWWLPFCSNQIAHLIQVGVVKDKASLNQWAKYLKDCVVALDSHDSLPF